MKRADPESRGLVSRFFRENVRPYLALQLEIVFCLLLRVALELVDPLILRALIDRALGDGDPGLLVLLVALLAGVLVFRTAFRMLSVWLYSYSGLRILFEFRQRAFERVERLSPYFFRGERFGDILARLTSDVDVLQRAAASTLVNAVQDVLTIVGIVSVLLWLDVRLTLVLLVLYPFLVLGLAWINRRLRAEGWRARDAIGDLYAFLEERIAGMRIVQEFLREKAEARRHVSVSRPWIRSNLKLSTMGAAQVSLADVMATAAMILIFLIGGQRVLGGELTVGTLVAFYTLANRLYRPISGLIDVNIDLQMARASLARVYALVDEEPEVRDPADPAPLPPVAGRLELAGVGLAYPGGSRVLDRVDLEIEAGQSVALVGPSGSGKSTLSALLARYLDPTQGAVRLDGVDLRAIRLRELRKRVGLVPQETLLFHDTVAANLRLARPDATDGKLVEVLSDVALGDFLAGLPEGLDTIVGAQGLRLSGGERQRLALARALLKDAPLLILDEATSALDPGTERRVLSRLFEQRAGRTTILIAHRLTSITDVDRILVLSEGRLVQTGTHDELYRRPGLYRALWDDQSRRQETG